MIIELKEEGTGRVIMEWDCPEELWIDIQAFAEATDSTIDQVIARALADFFDRPIPK